MWINLAPLKKHRDFRLLFTGQVISFCGSMISYVAVPYQVYDITKSSFYVGLLGATQLTPLLITALFGGAFADSLDRRKLLIWSEFAMACCSLGLVLNCFLPHPQVWIVFLLSSLMAAINGFHRPSLDSLTPRLVDREDFPAVAALSSLRFSIGAILGPAIAGLLIAHFGIAITYALDVLSFAISLLALSLIRTYPEQNATKKKKIGIGAISEGLRYALSRPELVGTYLVDIVAMIFAMPSALFPALAIGWGGAKATGWLYSAMPIGCLAITLTSSWTGNIQRHGAAVILSAAGWGIAIIALGFVHSLPLAVFCLALAGASDTISGIFRGCIWNETIPNDYRGRLAGIEMISYMTGPLLGNFRAGCIATWMSNEVSIISGGIICSIGVLAFIPLLPKFWAYRSLIASQKQA